MVSIREAAGADVPSITAIQNALLATTLYEWTETPYTEAERHDWLERQRAAGHPVLVADDAGAVVGWAAYGDFRDSTKWPGYRPTVEHTVQADAQPAAAGGAAGATPLGSCWRMKPNM